MELKDMYSGYRGTPELWVEFFLRWNQKGIELGKHKKTKLTFPALTSDFIKAKEESILLAEGRLKTSFPKSYRDFMIIADETVLSWVLNRYKDGEHGLVPAPPLVSPIDSEQEVEKNVQEVELKMKLGWSQLKTKMARFGTTFSEISSCLEEAEKANAELLRNEMSRSFRESTHQAEIYRAYEKGKAHLYKNRFMSIDEIDWLRNVQPDFSFDAWENDELIISDETYYQYNRNPGQCDSIRGKYIRSFLQLSLNEDGDICILNPIEKTKDNEWEAWLFMSHNGDALRFQSFVGLICYLYIFDMTNPDDMRWLGAEDDPYGIAKLLVFANQ